jgi:diaminopimelate epimerase
MEFAKLHALGNDFLVMNVAGVAYPQALASHARQICDRHCGVGADGILYYQPTIGDPEADFSALIFNADGSKAEMSGNGVRCLAAFLHQSGQSRRSTVRIRTVSGVRVLTLHGKGGETYTFETSMGAPVTDPVRIPARLAGLSGPVVEHPLEVGSEVVKVTLCSMGNPHCSTFWPDLESAPVDRLGPLLESHDIFPNRTNVEFIQVVDRHQLRTRFWERGVGPTLASGTGSSAAAVAAILNDLAESPVTVHTEMGTLLVSWENRGEVLLTGPAQFICTGWYPKAVGSNQ